MIYKKKNSITEKVYLMEIVRIPRGFYREFIVINICISDLSLIGDILLSILKFYFGSFWIIYIRIII